MFSDVKYVSLPETVIGPYVLNRGDVLFNRTNSQEWVGKVAIYRHDSPAVFASYLLTSAFLKEYYIFIYMRPKGSADRLEYRRQWAVALLDEGKGINEVARLIQASPSSVHRWKELKKKHGAEGLKAKPHPGRGCQLSSPDKEQLKQLLLAGPQAAGFDTALWTCGRVAQVIAQTFGVSYHPDHVGRLLHGVGFFMPVSPAPGARTG